MASSLSQKVRSFNIFFCFGVFAFGAVLNGILIYLVLTLCCWQRRRRVLCFRYVVRLSFRFFLKLCGVLRAFSVQGSDFTALKDLKGAIFIANHPSLVDYIILSSRLPISTSVMVKAKLTHSFMRFVISGLGYVTNECDPQELNAIIARGENVLIFPEGTRTAPNGVIHFHRGFANLALETQASIFPLFISLDVPGFLAQNFWSFRAPKKVPMFSLALGQPISCKETLVANEPRGIWARHFTHQVEEIYQSHLKAQASTDGENLSNL